jgi:hypothetical protein
MKSYWMFLELEIKRAHNWLASNLMAKVLVITGMLAVISLVLIGEFALAHTYFGFLSLQERFGQAIAQYSINAAIFLIFWISVASSLSISNRFLFQTKYLAHVITTPISVWKLFNSRLLMIFLTASWTMWLLVPILMAYGLQFLQTPGFLLRALLILSCLSLSSLSLGTLIIILLVNRLGTISKLKMMIMGAGFALLSWSLLRMIFPPQFRRLYYASDWEAFKLQLSHLPLYGDLLPTNWLAKTITLGWSWHTLAALVLTGLIVGLCWWWGRKLYLAAWRRSYQSQLWAGRRLPIAKKPSNFPYLSNSKLGAIVTNLLLGLERSASEMAYMMFLFVLLLVILFLIRAIPGLEKSAPQFIPMINTLAFMGLVHLWLLLSARVIYPLMAHEKLTGWLMFSLPMKRQSLLGAQMVFAWLLSWPALVVGLVAAVWLKLPIETMGWFSVMMLVTVVGVVLCQLFWGAIRPNFSEADNPESASTSGSGFAALGCSLFLMFAGGYHVYLMMSREINGLGLLLRLTVVVAMVIVPLGWWAKRSLYGYQL